MSSPTHPAQFQSLSSLQLQKNQRFFSGSKVARVLSLITHIHLAPVYNSVALYINTSCLPPWHILGQFYFTSPRTYVPLPKGHIFLVW